MQTLEIVAVERLSSFANNMHFRQYFYPSIVTRSVQPEPPAVTIVRQNGRSSASCRASVAVTPVSRQIWWVQVVGGRPQARLHPVKAAHHPSSWCRFVGSGLLVHRFEVWRRDRGDPEIFL